MKYKAFVLSLLASAGTVLLSMASSPAAHAYSVSFNSSGESTIGINDGDVGTTLDPTTFAGTSTQASRSLLAKAVLTVVNFTDSNLTLRVDIQNLTNTSAGDSFSASVRNIWFKINNAHNVQVAGGTLFQSASIANSGRVRIRTGPGTGLLAADGATSSDSFELSFAGDFGAANSGIGSTSIRDFDVQFRSGSGQHLSTDRVAGVPEPITILGSGAALAFGAVMKRRASKQDASS